MSVTNRWYDDEKTIIITDYISFWAWDEHAEAIREAYAMMDEAGHAADIIACNIGAELPKGNPLLTISKLYRSPEEMDHINVYVQAAPMVHTFVKIYEKIHPVSVGHNFFADTVDQAVEIIREWRRNKKDKDTKTIAS
jgi:hypothetical protein